MEKFAEYGFNKAHSAAYALLSYRTAWLKAHYPKEFMATLLTHTATSKSDKEKYNKLSRYINECRSFGLNIYKPSVNKSAIEFTIAPDGLICGLCAIKGLSANVRQEIIAKRQNDVYASFSDFCSRIDRKIIDKKAIETLIKSGACDGLGLTRKTMLSNFDHLLASHHINNTTNMAIHDLPEYYAPQLLALEKEALGFHVTEYKYGI